MKLDELAKLAGVSRTTVSYVVNGKAKQYRVSQKTIDKIQALIEQYDFKPNAMAAGLRVGRSYTIGLIVPDFENISYAKITNQLENKFRERGYQLLITCSNDNAESEIDCAKHLFQRQIDALIVSSALPVATDFYTQYKKTPIFCFDRRLASQWVTNLTTNDEEDAYRLASQLLQQGDYQQILFLGALPELPISREREQGFRRAIANHLQITADFIYAKKFHKEEAAETFAAWLAEHGLPQVIFTTSLTLLQGVFSHLLHQRGSIDPALVIATFGTHEMLDVLPNKAICSVQNHENISNNLVELVIAQLNNCKTAPNQTALLRDITRHNF